MSFSPPSARRSPYPNPANPNTGYPMTGRVPRTSLSPARRDLSPPPATNYNYNGMNNPNYNPSNNISRPRRQVNNEARIPNTETVQESAKPLLPPGNTNVPLAGPETDDSDDRETVHNVQPGVDDGFFTNDNNPDAETIPAPPKEPEEFVPKVPSNPNFPPGEPGFGEGPGIEGIDETDLGRYPTLHPRFPEFPYAPGYGPDVYNVNFPSDYPGTEFGSESIPDVNIYQHKKTLAQGMMDLALFSANANQLRYVLESYDRHPYYYPSVILIAFSLLFQVCHIIYNQLSYYSNKISLMEDSSLKIYCF